MTAPLSPAPVRDDGPDHLPPYLSNGLIGLRVRGVPLRAGVAVVNGLSGEHPEVRVDSAPFVPYPLAGEIRIGGVSLTDHPHRTRVIEQIYDFACGELVTRFEIDGDGARAQVEVLTFCSRTHPAVVLQEVVLHLDAAADLVMSAVVDPNGLAGVQVERTAQIPGQDDSLVDGSMRWNTLGALSSCGIAYATEFSADDAERKTRRWEKVGALETAYKVRGRAGRRYVLRQFAALVDGDSHHLPDTEAVRLIARARKNGFDALRRENHRAWDDLWQSRIVLGGADERWQRLADAAFFYMTSSTHASAMASTHIFGLAQWPTYHYYYGHVMWDTETFAMPLALVTQPDAVRAMLDYRFRTRTAAHANARLNGFAGMQFPWQSGPTGEESAPGDGLGSAFAHHVSLGVAHAFANYVYATGDMAFLRERALPVLVGVADFIRSRVTKTSRGYEILQAMGIAEREKACDNNAYTNLSAKVVLRDAIACMEMAGRPVPDWWGNLERKIVVPMDSRGERIVSYDDYHPTHEKGETPDPLAAFFPVGYEAPPDVERRTVEYYLELADDYIGSPMLSALYGVWAARIGDRRRATKLLDEGYAKFVSDRFMNTHEWRHDKFPEYPRAGPFIANLGGFIVSLIYGFPRLVAGAGDLDTWCRGPIVMPDAWDSIEISRLILRGREVRLVAKDGEPRAHIEIGEACIP